jgi:hypothetical protein
MGQTSPQPIVMTTSEAWTASVVSGFGVGAVEVNADLRGVFRVHLGGYPTSRSRNSGG